VDQGIEGNFVWGEHGMNAVIVGAPMEQQTVYGPFEDFEAASDFADTVRNEYAWIITLVKPEELI